MGPFEPTLKFAAVSGIFMIWLKFTKEAFNFSWHIISSSPGEETYKAVTKVQCKECKEFFDEDEDEEFICFTCRGDHSLVD